MSEFLNPGRGIIFMKVGTHAQEPLADIIRRKRQEIETAGIAFWGYGGSTCHPRTMVQPFARQFEQRGETIYLCMEPMESNHFAPQVCATEYSEDGYLWKPVPSGIRPLGSRYALIIKNIEEADFELPLARTIVSLGNSAGTAGSRYIRGRVDKACLELTSADVSGSTPISRSIGFVAQLEPPYAVFLRSSDPASERE